MNKFLIISNQAFSLHNFRGALIKKLVSSGFTVYALAPDYTEHSRKKVNELGAITLDYRLSRSKLNVLDNINSLIDLISVLLKLKPSIILAYSIKPVLFSIPIAYLLRIEKRFSMIEGLGYVFMEDNSAQSYFRKFLKFVIKGLYKLSCKFATKAIFLNDDDIDLFIKNNLVDERKVFKIDGIGVDTNYFSPSLPVISPISFIFVGRLLLEKGIEDFIDAAIIIHKKFRHVHFYVAGGLDLNPGSITESQLLTFKKLSFITFLGEVDDIRSVLLKSSVFVLPSYREGLPRSTIEAMSMQKPIITTDVPGCRQTVIDSLNGFIVDVRNPIALANAMEKFITNTQFIVEMGQQSRNIAVNRFKDSIINDSLIELFSK